ncbi:periplasmic binding protein (plasmid) [Ketogulonicigenium vulgare Y25]|nr:iron-siderophore ABC transporter substrate-binding protein [Ketogulonicigenium vulgare]ADO44128.1 periplasmic binding protein [Ketogulonicigenium vulgare Y25]
MRRRAFLLAMASAMATCHLRPARAGSPLRVAAIDWAMAETAIMLGHAPVAMAELLAFRTSTPAPPPASTIDLGLRGAPNLEAVTLADPDLILSSNYYTFIEPQLSRIAPVYAQTLFTAGDPPLPRLLALVTSLAARIGIDGTVALAQANETLDSLAQRLSANHGTPCLLVEIGDSRHVRVFGDDSLFGGILTRLGLRNAWAEGTQFSFAAPVPIASLARFTQARIITVGDIPPQVTRGLGASALWNALPAVQAGRVSHLPDMNGFGGLPSGLFFADRLTAALEAQL